MKKFRDLLAKDIESAKVIIAGLPFDDHASVGKGSALAPLKIRKLSANLPPFSRDGLIYVIFLFSIMGIFHLMTLVRLP